METEKKVAVIGLGNIGKAIAQDLTNNNHQVIVASRNKEESDLFAEQSGGLAESMNISQAIETAEIIIPAIWFGAFKDFFNEHGNTLKDKIIVDVSNPITPDGNGGFKKIIGEKESAGELNKVILPKGAKLVKAFGTLGAGSLAGASNKSPEKAVLFYASDDSSINNDIENVINNAGFDPLRIGGIDQSIRIEVFGDLHEFGALGKTVSLSEAKSKL
ncbi:NADP oxidoreductase coenzyme F420-dependent [Chryseobacterium lactis]|uniref:NADP oxidoreductase coenzyme F420-dependent n=1 Tax=Chryseobacterium lactis TaxID=1241981 RepID=A0A3G6RGK8_CHRLC|nr:NAD(P)-binding domain-containing protein [Chryseobacterium lactis]AZA83786.1 NADP oxidoreductase coenzyme F420-dependent [Chryseobacterium lactis]AZB04171.1 NADP oxidoreductase coenzyme F420-dependent [Chryseobacterium lactis]PNW12920.1 NADP oxidoreductase coenzyme F420-dependent [Chryseobacterium lactis]